MKIKFSFTYVCRIFIWKLLYEIYMISVTNSWNRVMYYTFNLPPDEAFYSANPFVVSNFTHPRIVHVARCPFFSLSFTLFERLHFKTIEYELSVRLNFGAYSVSCKKHVGNSHAQRNGKIV